MLQISKKNKMQYAIDYFGWDIPLSKNEQHKNIDNLLSL